MGKEPVSLPVDAVILRILRETQSGYARPIYRTALVKLVYLVDYFYAQHVGRTLTGLDYFWDDHGPNAVSNKIVKRADGLQSPAGPIEIEKGVTPSGNPKYLYRLTREAEPSRLDDLGERIIHDVVMTYGSLNWKAIVKAAKATRPILRAKRGDRLNLIPDAEKQRRLATVRAKLGGREYDTGRPGVTITDLRARYGLSG